MRRHTWIKTVSRLDQVGSARQTTILNTFLAGTFHVDGKGLPLQSMSTATVGTGGAGSAKDMEADLQLMLAEDWKQACSIWRNLMCLTQLCMLRYPSGTRRKTRSFFHQIATCQKMRCSAVSSINSGRLRRYSGAVLTEQSGVALLGSSEGQTFCPSINA